MRYDDRVLTDVPGDPAGVEFGCANSVEPWVLEETGVLVGSTCHILDMVNPPRTYLRAGDGRLGGRCWRSRPRQFEPHIREREARPRHRVERLPARSVGCEEETTNVAGAAPCQHAAGLIHRQCVAAKFRYGKSPELGVPSQQLASVANRIDVTHFPHPIALPRRQ